MINILMVCLGNICRSPTAHAVLEKKISEAGLQGVIHVDSAGTGDWHIGHPPDSRAQQVAGEHGYDLSYLRAENVNAQTDFSQYDYVLAMDKKNLQNLQQMITEQGGHYQGFLGLLMAFDTESACSEVPDPYYGGEDGFITVLAMIETACDQFLDYVIDKHHLLQQD